MEDKLIKEDFSYDSRRKELKVEKVEIQEFQTPEETDNQGNKIAGEKTSTVEFSTKTVFTEKGIRIANENLSRERVYLEQTAKKLKHQFENEPKLTEEEINLKKMLKRINQAESAEKARSEYENVQKRLTENKREHDKLIKAVGSRLKL